jgi:hypothetical protein
LLFDIVSDLEFMAIQHQESNYLRAYKAHPSTSVENVRQISLFLTNKPNFSHFSPKNEDFTKKQTQFKPNSKPILGQYQGWHPKSQIINHH